MNTQEPTGSSEAFAALAAADPALGQSEDTARLAQIRERVLARTRAEESAQGTMDRRFRSRKLAWVGGAAAACALVAVGGLGGAAISASGGGGGGQIVAASSPMMPTMGSGQGNRQGNAAAEGAPTRDSASSTSISAPGVASDARMGMDKAMPSYGYYGWRTILEPGDGITDEAGTAAGYAYVKPDADPSKVAADLAAALGVSGDPVDQSGDGTSWVVGPIDGSGPQVWVGSWGSMVNWNYSDPGAYVACTSPVSEPMPAEDESASKGSDSAGSGASAGEPTPPCADAGTPPSEKEAVARAKELLAATGVDPASVEWEVYRDDYSASATAWQLVNGQRTSMGWSFAFSQNDRVQWASGFVSELTEVPAYPIVGARTAIERTKDPRWSSMLNGPIGGPLYAARDVSASVVPGAGAPVTKDGRPVISMPVATAVIEKAELGLTQYSQPDGSIVLVPAYQLTAVDGSTWSVLAITEDYVDFSVPQS